MTGSPADALRVAAPARPVLPVAAGGGFPVTRIFCVGRNYAEHAAEMGAAPEPIFFMKPAEAAVFAEADVPYPPETERLDHEVELVVALGAGGRPKDEAAARGMIFGYAVGADMTRRDVQSAAKAKGGPWEAAKAFDGAAAVERIHPAAEIGHPRRGRIWFSVDGETRQTGDLSDMILSPEALLVSLARFWSLQPGDLVFTGTPAGVGPITPGQLGRGGIEGVGEMTLRLSR